MTKPHLARRSSSLRIPVILIALIGTLYFARDILIPLALAVTLALILTPAVTRLVKLHVGRAFAALAVVVITLVTVGGFGVVIFNQLIQVLDELPGYQENIHNKIQAMRAPAKGPLGRATENVRELGKELSNTQTPVAPPPQQQQQRDQPIRRSAPAEPGRPLPVQIVTEPANELQYLRDLTRPFLAPLGTLGIVIVFTLYLLIEQHDLRDRLFRLAGLSRMNLVTQALDDATRRVSRYLMLQFLVNACFGVLCGLGLYFIGLPYAALWGAVAAIFRIIPYVGSTIAALLPLILSLAVFDTWRQPVLVFIMFAGLELLTANLVEPWLYGIHTGISSLALLLTTVFWTILWGPAGLILSTPLTVCLVVLGRHVPQFSFLHVLLGDEPALAADAQLYQRLLAMDDHGARAVVDQHLVANSVPELYDSVLIPMLTMVERDRHKGTLDADREEFIFMGIREMIGEAAAPAQGSRRSGSTEASALPGGRILCVPADDESDEIAAAMLAQLLETTGRATILFATGARLQHMIRMSAPAENDTFCISALPPFAFARARVLASYLRRRFPKTRIVVGVWGFTGDADRALRRFEAPAPDRLVTSLASAVEWMAGDGNGSAVEANAPMLAL